MNTKMIMKFTGIFFYVVPVLYLTFKKRLNVAYEKIISYKISSYIYRTLISLIDNSLAKLQPRFQKGNVDLHKICYAIKY
jgi:hypothetical protein